MTELTMSCYAKCDAMPCHRQPCMASVIQMNVLETYSCLVRVCTMSGITRFPTCPFLPIPYSCGRLMMTDINHEMCARQPHSRLCFSYRFASHACARTDAFRSFSYRLLVTPNQHFLMQQATQLHWLCVLLHTLPVCLTNALNPTLSPGFVNLQLRLPAPWAGCKTETCIHTLAHMHVKIEMRMYVQDVPIYPGMHIVLGAICRCDEMEIFTPNSRERMRKSRQALLLHIWGGRIVPWGLNMRPCV